MVKEIELIKYTIVLNRPLPRRELTIRKWYVDGVKLNTPTMILLLKKAGHTAELRNETSMVLSNKYKGIKLVSCNGGLMVYPKNKLNFDMLKRVLLEDEYFYHSCYLPVKKK
jgi:hypothetical protein